MTTQRRPSTEMERLQSRGEIAIFGMDQVLYHRCGSQQPYLGTRDLNGCFAVFLLSTQTKGAIGVHIGPRASREDTAPDAGLNHCKNLMRQMLREYEARKDSFPRGSLAWTVYGIAEDGWTMDDQLAYIRRKFGEIGAVETTNGYDVTGGFRVRPRGEAFVGFRDGKWVAWLEDKPCSLSRSPSRSPPRRTTPPTTTVSSSASAGASASVTSATSSAAAGSSSSSWYFVEREGQPVYFQMQDGKAVSQRSFPPNNQRIYNWVDKRNLGVWNPQSGWTN